MGNWAALRRGRGARVLVSTEKNPVKVRAGALGAALRWGPKRVIRLDDLTGPQRALVLALVGQMKAAPASEVPGAATTGSTRDADRQTAA